MVDIEYQYIDAFLSSINIIDKRYTCLSFCGKASPHQILGTESIGLTPAKKRSSSKHLRPISKRMARSGRVELVHRMG
jgi:hypothetical protein